MNFGITPEIIIAGDGNEVNAWCSMDKNGKHARRHLPSVTVHITPTISTTYDENWIL